jgi:hypothetical protein
MGPYTALQLLEIVVFTGIALYGVLDRRHPSAALLGIGLLVSKAIMASLPSRYSVVTRSLVGYGLGLSLAAVTVLVIRKGLVGS